MAEQAAVGDAGHNPILATRWVPSCPAPLSSSPGTVKLLATARGKAYVAFVATTLEQIAEQAMKLPGESRAQLADLLVESRDAETLGRINQLWLTEAERRRDDVPVDAIPGDEARRRVRSSIKR